jgi:uncharacterized protein (DUF983 family)
VWLFRKVCPACGEGGKYDGWHHSMIEAIGAYQRRYGLKPIGPHRQLADQLFTGATCTCPLCGGRGLLDAEVEDGYTECPLCRGTGRLMLLDAEEFHARRREVLVAYPDAAAPLG